LFKTARFDPLSIKISTVVRRQVVCTSAIPKKKALLSQRWPRDAPYIWAIHPNFVHAYGH